MTDTKGSAETPVTSFGGDERFLGVDNMATTPTSEVWTMDGMGAAWPTSWISDTDSTDSLGSTAKKWLAAFLDTLVLGEQASAPADVAGDGQYWVRNDAPNRPMFTDDAGTDYVLAKGVSTEASSATPTINTDISKAHSITALDDAVTSMTTNLSGTPANFDTLIVRFLDDGTARAITWGASFQAMGAALPTTTTISKVLTVGFIYDTVDAKWGCVASVDEA